MKKILIIVLVVLVIGLWGCPQKADMYTVEEHVKMITEKYNERFKVEHWYRYEDGTKAESFSVYPLYNEKEELSMFLIEIEPYGFEFVKTIEDNSFFDILLSCNNRRSMYIKTFKDYGHDGVSDVWEKCIINETNGESEPILDENGERVFYRKSPFYVTGNMSERKYLIQTRKTHYIFAVKKNGEFINLISESIVDVKNTKAEDLYDKQATLRIDYLDYPNFKL